jgi:hypothetical protein
LHKSIESSESKTLTCWSDTETKVLSTAILSAKELWTKVLSTEVWSSKVIQSLLYTLLLLMGLI